MGDVAIAAGPEWAPRLPPVAPGELLAGRVIDVCIWGASRPDLFEQTIASFRQRVRFSGRLRFFLDDGCFDEERAARSAAIARAHGFDGIHVERIVHEGGVGSYGWAMTRAIARWVRAPLMFSLEDDWTCLRDIDLDLAFDLFAAHAHVNQLRYNRRKNSATQNQGALVFARRELLVGGRLLPFLSSPHWMFNPAIWRMDYVRPRWLGCRDNVHWFINSPNGFLPDGPRPSPDWYADTLGVLTFGDVGEPAYFEHTGRAQSIHRAQGRV